MNWKLCCAVSLGLSVAACAGPKFVGRTDLNYVGGGEMPAPMREDVTVPSRPYAIGPSDELSIDVFGVSELSQRVVVDASGQISMPLLGSLTVSGMTASEVADTITRGLKGAYVRNPSVSVNISKAVSQVVTVDGAVGRPGLYPLSGRMSLLRAIALASSTTEFARENHVVVFRESGGKKYAALYDLRAIRQGAYGDPDIYANDIIVVGDSQARRVFKDVLAASGLITTPIIAILQ